MKFSYLSYLILTFCLTQIVFGQNGQINGQVKNSEGIALEKVRIITSNYNVIKTNSEGKFKISSSSKYLFVQKSSYEQKLVKVENNSKLKIILGADENRIFLKDCSKNKNKKVGQDIKFIVPKGFKSKKSKDIDYFRFVIYEKKNKSEYIEGWSGPNADGLFPDSKFIKQTKKIITRSIYDKRGRIGVDFSGKTKKGVHWRKISVFMDYINYKVGSEDMKNKFDYIINTGCSNLSKYDN